MEKKFKLGVIGAGYMAYSIVKGALSSNVLKPTEVFACDINDKSLEKFSLLGVQTTLETRVLADSCDFVLLSVKPQNFSEVASAISSSKCDKYISIMAGVKKQKIKDKIDNSRVARCMPNAPCSVGSGAVGIDLSDFENEEDKNFVLSIFSSIARVVQLDEDKMNAVTGVSGSSPAYFYLFAKSIIDGGVKNGLTRQEAFDLVVNTMIGSGKMLLENKEKSIDELINSVCSKGGTTLEAIKVFNDSGLSKITCDAVDACVNRSFELEKL